MRIGLFGGSFDPVHLGHLAAAEAAREEFGLDQVRFVPAARQPFKVEGHVASPDDRAAMLEAAVAGHDAFVVDKRELDRPGPSYTVDTVRALRTEFPDAELFLILGADAAREFGSWREAAVLATLAQVIVLKRPGSAVSPAGAVGTVVDMPGFDLSASQVRDRVRHGRSIRYLVPPAVEMYIRRHGLYRDPA